MDRRRNWSSCRWCGGFQKWNWMVKRGGEEGGNAGDVATSNVSQIPTVFFPYQIEMSDWNFWIDRTQLKWNRLYRIIGEIQRFDNGIKVDEINWSQSHDSIQLFSLNEVRSYWLIQRQSNVNRTEIWKWMRIIEMNDTILLKWGGSRGGVIIFFFTRFFLLLLCLL